MTFRCVAVGLALGAAICGISFFNDNVIQQPALMGSYLPISVFGAVMLIVMAVNPLLGLLRRSLAFSGRELAVVAMLALIAGAVSGGVLPRFNTQIMMPHHLEKSKKHWQQAHVIDQLPEQMLADPTRRDGADPLEGYLRGMGDRGGGIGLSDIPWYAWQRALCFYMPLLLALSIALMGLSLVVHQQWSENERLRYPIARFAAALMPSEGAREQLVFRTRRFWLGAAAVFAIHIARYVRKWVPQMIEIPLHVDLRPVFGLSEVYMGGSPGDVLMMPELHFTVIGFTFFLASDVSLSLGLGPHLFTYVMGLFLIAGIKVQGGVMAPSGGAFLFAGAWSGICLMLLYTGRRHYASVFRKALLFKGESGAKDYAIWGARVFVVGAVAFVVMLIRLGLDWPLAILYSGGVVMIYVVLSRLVAETGVYLIHPYFGPAEVLFGFLGMAAIGPQSYLIMLVMGTMVLMSPSSALMPYVVQGLKIVDVKGIRPGRSVAFGVAALLLGFAVTVPVALYFQYDMGVYQIYKGPAKWTLEQMPRYAIDAAIRTVKRHEPAEGYPTEAPGGLAAFSRIQPEPKLVICFAVAIGLVLLFSAARLRFRWWPFHPVMFAVLATYQAQLFAFSFLVGWLIKKVVCGLGGGGGYIRARPLMIGLIAGEIFAKVVSIIFGASYYFVSGGIRPPQ
ncbi:MAG: DUF6785 family protein [Planctomycetota bacterium]|jgi:hypothetical protein